MATAQPTPNPPLPFSIGEIEIPAGCRRIFITAELTPSSGDPRIQPTGFPDIGPVLYADPAERDGLICLIESEASMANRLEEICLASKYDGSFRAALTGLPYIRVTRDGEADGELVTTSTLDGHRFASEYIMRARIPGEGKPEFAEQIMHEMGMQSKDRCPVTSVPRIFRLAMEYDPMSLLHGFQISVAKKLTFVGLRSPRAITASIIGLDCDRITVPGVRIDPIGDAAAAQAIFQKPRISAKRIEARFSIDVGLLASLTLTDDRDANAARTKLLLAIAICKTAWFLSELQAGLRLRTDCDLKAIPSSIHWWPGLPSGGGAALETDSITKCADETLRQLIAASNFPPGRSPSLLEYARRDNTPRPSENEPSEEPAPDDEEEGQ